ADERLSEQTGGGAVRRQAWISSSAHGGARQTGPGVMLRIEGSYREDPVVRFLRVVHRAGLRQAAVAPPADGGGERLTHVEVARRAGLSRPSVARYASKLKDTVLEPGTLVVRPESGYALGVDLASAHRARV